MNNIFPTLYYEKFQTYSTAEVILKYEAIYIPLGF